VPVQVTQALDLESCLKPLHTGTSQTQRARMHTHAVTCTHTQAVIHTWHSWARTYTYMHVHVLTHLPYGS
jgi:hypothetical protein